MTEEEAIEMQEKAEAALINANEAIYQIINWAHDEMEILEKYYVAKIKYYEQQASHARILRVCLTGKP